MNWKTVVTASLIFAALFVGFGGLHFGFEVRTVFLLVVLGVTLGFLAAPEFERRNRSSWAVIAWQTFAGTAGGICVALLIQVSVEAAGIGALLGGLLGFMAPAWIRHVQVP